MRFADKRGTRRGRGVTAFGWPEKSHWDYVRSAGFTLTETVAAMVLAMLMLTALYASLTFGFNAVRLSREDLEQLSTNYQRIAGYHKDNLAVPAGS